VSADQFGVPAPTSAEPASARSLPVGPAAAVPYDFRRPTKLSREHARVLQVAYETFASRMTTLLTSGLRQFCRVQAGDIGQQTYDEYINGLPNPTVLLPVALSPLPGTATLQLSVPVAMAAIDHMLGGPGDDEQPMRPMTDIEMTLFRGLLDQFMSVLRYALEPIVAVQPEVGAVEYTPQFLQAAPATDPMIVGDFELTIGKETCRMTISIPLASLLPRLVALRPQTEAPPRPAPDTSKKVLGALRGAPVEVAVRFRPVAIDSARLLTLSVGDVVKLDHPVEAPLWVEAGDTRILSAVAGRSGNRLAALIVGDRTYPWETP
jgi:flagellar motor switch protein FliM